MGSIGRRFETANVSFHRASHWNVILHCTQSVPGQWHQSSPGACQWRRVGRTVDNRYDVGGEFGFFIEFVNALVFRLALYTAGDIIKPTNPTLLN